MSDELGNWSGPEDVSAAAPDDTAAVTGEVQEAVDRVMRRRLEELATAAVDEVLDDGQLSELREAAAAAAPHVLARVQGVQAETYYPNLLAFMTGLLLPVYRRSLSGSATAWCSQWWRHGEAIVRLEAVWRAWEHLRADPHLGVSVWLLNHADPHMAVLLSAEGPFKGCKPEQHHPERLARLPHVDPADGNTTLR